MAWQFVSAMTIVLVAQNLITGASSSTTVTVKLQVFVFRLVSHALHMTVVGPSGKVAPFVGAQITMGLSVQLSVAETEKLTTAEQSPESVPIVTLVEQVMFGGVTSSTVKA